MLKLNASFSKKVPVPGEDYSSRSYHASVEVELPDGLAPEDLQSRIRDTFALVRDSVETELADDRSPADAPPAVAEPPSRALPPPGSPAPPRRDTRRSAPQGASPKQIGFLCDLAARQGLTHQDVDAAVARKFGISGVAALNRHQASQFIDDLRDRRAA